MITANGTTYGRATEVAQALGPDVTPDMVRAWGRRGRVHEYRPFGGLVWYRLDQAAAEEARARASRRGRPRGRRNGVRTG